jgi:hypothetical protein
VRVRLWLGTTKSRIPVSSDFRLLMTREILRLIRTGGPEYQSDRPQPDRAKAIALAV